MRALGLTEVQHIQLSWVDGIDTNAHHDCDTVRSKAKKQLQAYTRVDIDAAVA